mmetsp:Transcript_101182/g.283640  ORF Transcript_101182/g.283640 Transcript_101182/m.283640 type:complete len:405 (+) Transcript_101182:370-1584(+)
MDRVDELTRVLQTAAVPGAVRAAHPTRVHQVRVRAVLVQLGGQHLRIHERVPHEEWGAEARREGGLRLLNALLGARNLSGVAGNEVIHDLVLRQLGDRRQHSESIARKQDDLLRMVLHLGRNPRVGDEAQWVGHSRVLRDARVVVVHCSRRLVEDHVLQHRPEADSVIDLRLLLSRQANGLGVAAALDIEHTLRMPDMLVVADELALGVRAQRGLAGPAQAKEDRDVVVRANVRGGVQRQRAVRRREVPLRHQRHQVVHDGKDPLLHLTGILRAQDHHLATLEGHRNGRGGGHALGLAIGGKHTGVEDDEGGLEARLQLLLRRRHEHILHEKGVVRAGSDHPHGNPVLLVPAAIPVDDVEPLASVQVVDSTLAVGQEGLVVELDVDLPPPDVVSGGFLKDDALV